jgi:hypothetical protein
MGIHYSNITFQGVSQSELVDYLSNNYLDAYVSPTVNGYTVLYDVASIGYSSKISQAIQLEANFKALLQQYRDGHSAAMVCLSSHLSKKFICCALAVWAIDSLKLWYHLSQRGRMLDEYVTRGDKQWRSGRTLGETANGEIKGGDARTLGRAFGKEEAIAEIEAILSKPIEDFRSIDRHEALAKALGIRPCWVVGMNYLCCTGEDDFEAHYEDNREESDPTLEEAIALVRRTSTKSII